jgi:hypothetical protein
MWERKAN